MESYTWFGRKDQGHVKRLGGYSGAYAYFKWNDEQCSSTTDPDLFFRLFQLDLKHGASANLIFNVVCHSCAHYIIKVKQKIG